LANLNKTFHIGRLTADPELKYTPSGTAKTTFRIAVNRVYKDATGAKQEDTTFIPVVCWAGLAENVASYMVKGKEVHVEGRLRIYTTKDETTGQNKYFTEIVANSVLFLGAKGDAIDKGAGQTPKAQENFEVPF